MNFWTIVFYVIILFFVFVKWYDIELIKANQKKIFQDCKILSRLIIII
jgi:hypothetical protein